MSRNAPLRALIAVMIGALLAPLMFASAASAAERPAQPTQTAGSTEQLEVGGGLMMTYYRTWRDVTVMGNGGTAMSDIPAGVDVAFVFPDYTPPESPYWSTLKNSYVPSLHAQGTKVVMTKDFRTLINSAYSNDATGYNQLADKLIAENVTAYNLDGLDFDIEQQISGEDLQRATGVMKALRAKLGSGKLLILDTNQSGSNALFRNVAGDIDYLLEQSYGRSVSGLQGTWDTFAPYIPASKYLIGFSFYEENGAFWGDTNAPFESSRAYQYAQWQPNGATKGGIFSYAVDRDWKAAGDNSVTPATFDWTKRLLQVLG